MLTSAQESTEALAKLGHISELFQILSGPVIRHFLTDPVRQADFAGSLDLDTKFKVSKIWKKIMKTR